MVHCLKIVFIACLMALGYWADAQKYSLDCKRFYRHDASTHIILYDKDEIGIYDDKNSVDILTENITDSRRVRKKISFLTDTSDNKDTTKKHIFIGVIEQPGMYRMNINDTSWNLYAYATPDPYERIDSSELNSVLDFKYSPVSASQTAMRIFIQRFDIIFNQFIKPEVWNEKLSSIAKRVSDSLPRPNDSLHIPNIIINCAVIIDTNDLVGVLIRGDHNDTSYINVINSYFDTVLSALTDSSLYKDTITNKKDFISNTIAPFISDCENVLLAFLQDQKEKGIIIKKDYSYASVKTGLDDTTPGILFDFRRNYFRQWEFCIHFSNIGRK